MVSDPASPSDLTCPYGTGVAFIAQNLLKAAHFTVDHTETLFLSHTVYQKLKAVWKRSCFLDCEECVCKPAADPTTTATCASHRSFFAPRAALGHIAPHHLGRASPEQPPRHRPVCAQRNGRCIFPPAEHKKAALPPKFIPNLFFARTFLSIAGVNGTHCGHTPGRKSCISVRPGLTEVSVSHSSRPRAQHCRAVMHRQSRGLHPRLSPELGQDPSSGPESSALPCSPF